MDQKNNSWNEKEDYLNSILNRIPPGIIVTNMTGNIIFVSKPAIKLLKLDYSVKNEQGLDILKILNHIPELSARLSKSLRRGGKPFDLEAETQANKFMKISARLIQNGMVLFIDDISKMKEIQANSILSIIEGQENERRRLAREIHDGIGPLLSAITLQLDLFIDGYKERDLEPNQEKLLDIRDTIDSINNDLRDLSHHLLPRLLDEFGLFSAFNNLTNRIKHSIRTSVEFYCNFNSETRFTKEIELNIYRAGQELLNNAIKHSRAAEIHVQIIKHDKSLVLMVEDDGKGFDLAESGRDRFGIGLTNIETRARTLHGDFTLDSVLNKGTTASIEIPL